ncbi:hypothetical protein CPB84DRAFT_1842143 [Gymnopilus junonius]|uniref:BTB domain-containing protein n=1 Tax=Gymnopilus junonius TaxID=109634 RepID=A0A9P5TTZ3_GYMJU|nr:hypothetical protein CPB84DRAFT_1842143 [Gymnopilus junonius]
MTLFPPHWKSMPTPLQIIPPEYFSFPPSSFYQYQKKNISRNSLNFSDPSLQTSTSSPPRPRIYNIYSTEAVYKAIHARDKEREFHVPALYALRNAKPFFVERAVEKLKMHSGKEYDYVFWNDASSFKEEHFYGAWPDPARVDRVWEEGSSPKSVKDWTEDLGPVEANISQGSFFGGSPASMTWFSGIFYSYHDHFLKLGYASIRDNTAIYNALLLLHPSRFITVWMSDPSAPAHGGLPPSFLGQGHLGACGDGGYYYQWWLSDRETREKMRRLWMTSASDSEVNKERFADLKKALWKDSLVEIGGSVGGAAGCCRRDCEEGIWDCPKDPYKDLRDGKISPEQIQEIKRIGTVIVKGGVPSEEALIGSKASGTMQLPMPIALPTDNVQVFEIYNSKAQTQARTHPSIIQTQKFLLSLWHTSSSSTAEAEVDLNTPITYFDRLRIRQPGDAKFTLGPHTDGGGVERWEDAGLRRVFGKILEGGKGWQSHDPFDAPLRIGVKQDLYNASNACSIFRAFQGWTSLSSTGPGEGTLQILPMLSLSSAYILLRPFFRPINPDSPSLKFEIGSWTSSHPGSGSSIGKTQELNEKTHPHLELERTMGTVMSYMLLKLDTVEGRLVCFYIPAVPLTLHNASYLHDQRINFLAGLPAPDFPGGEGESKFVGRGTPDDILSGEEGRKMYGLEAFAAPVQKDVNGILNMSNQPIEHHREYYIPGGDLYLQVGNVLFRAHSYFFERDSPKFRDLLWAHPEPNQVRPGSMDTDPIVIKTSSPRDFAKFLWVFYNPLYSVYEATSEEWIAILNIACEYEFTQVKDLAIRNLNLSDLSVVQRLYLYLLYRAHPIHTVPLYAILSTRDDGPSDADLKVLGVETTLSIFRIRERLLSQASGAPLTPQDEFVLQTIVLPSSSDQD